MNQTLEEKILQHIEQLASKTLYDYDAYHSMYSFFSSLSAEYREKGNNEMGNITKTLAYVTHMSLDARSRNMPIVPAIIFTNKQSVSPSDLQQEDRDILSTLYPKLSRGLLKSRIAEIMLFLDKPRRYDLVDEIIEGYLKGGLNEDYWYMHQESLWARAVILSRQFRKSKFINQIESQIETYLFSHSIGNIGISFFLLKFIQEFNLCSLLGVKLPELMMRHATYQRSQNDFHSAERLYYMASEFYKSLKMEPEWRKAIVESAEILFLEAEQRAGSESQGNLLAGVIYERALQRYRIIPKSFRTELGADNKIEESQKRARLHGELSLDDMHTFQLPSCDLSDLAEISINHVKDKGDIFKASLYFSGFKAIELKDLEDNDENKQTRISDLFGATYLSGDGRVIGRTGATGDVRADRMAKQLKSFDFSLKVAVAGEIMPAMYQLLKEYNFVLPFFQELCQLSPLIHTDRVNLVARALYLGFEYRFSEAIHLLSPQVEHLVRDMLKKANVRTSTIDEIGVENEIGLSSLLDKPEAESIFGKDLHFNFQALFTEALGANIRNYVAHGLLNDNSSQSEAVVYAWWLYFKIIVRSVTQSPLFRIPNPENFA
ncbi:uncharacterized protein DUF4209 [Gibbsiella quercinecans]|uniref:Uncharacterized protein n=1 Tax=Gibbsiella quercinecans TaxID=929813 RepID=A0A250B656_9GAMM|nr:DUF4209 domain-containing protein [Gibbsiella quercinecans]ATA21723.1 hypothetical protein AWC35_21610 [Gibbsiella quercinecans]RLM02564.1 hypothetical protein BIY31_23460 [Gibbsiella quercinecans]RLM03759.1 hypothetical protein BIY30_21530 [Gibbsiella quercinecans]TCT88988.1 uncharacterized protein DUF4209 [Gibbsiella quercinecans]